jgi:hypothetical protein
MVNEALGGINAGGGGKTRCSAGGAALRMRLARRIGRRARN